MAATNINRVVLTGNLTRDPELRSLPSGMSVCSLRIASNSRRKENGEWVDKPNYFSVTVWGAQGENASRFLSKGRPVAIDGRLEWREWHDKEGNKRESIEIVADSVQFLGGRDDAGGGGYGGGAGAATASPRTPTSRRTRRTSSRRSRSARATPLRRTTTSRSRPLASSAAGPSLRRPRLRRAARVTHSDEAARRMAGAALRVASLRRTCGRPASVEPLAGRLSAARQARRKPRRAASAAAAPAPPTGAGPADRACPAAA